MPCEYCLRYFGHSSSCPNYEEPMSNHNCSECGENILIGEKYIMNDYGDYAHLECVDNVKEFGKVSWLRDKRNGGGLLLI